MEINFVIKLTPNGKAEDYLINQPVKIDVAETEEQAKQKVKMYQDIYKSNPIMDVSYEPAKKIAESMDKSFIVDVMKEDIRKLAKSL